MQRSVAIDVFNVGEGTLLQQHHQERFPLVFAAEMKWCLSYLVPEVDILSHQDASLELVDVARSDCLHQVVLLGDFPVVQRPWLSLLVQLHVRRLLSRISNLSGQDVS